ncbi:MAG: c-type cytochrome [gamma proteobacterium endosymbiont of Lamellibrachia anaximandri]|nr:c-type cytochrome [gamma proteobacterium endosymbiont of Lamellibrachia anaximandri]
MKIIIQTLVVMSLLIMMTPQVLADLPPAFEGRKLYISHCQLCHAADGKGDGPLAKAMRIDAEDLTTVVRSGSDNNLIKIITGKGRHASTHRISASMPKWEEVFSEHQIKALVAYLRFLSSSKHDLIGDPEIGLQLYQKYCAICHGIEGDGKGIMTELLRIKPIDHTNPHKTEKLDNKELATSILDGRGKFMPAFRGVLNQSEVDGLVSYIRLLYQIWGKLEDGGLVILMRPHTVDMNEENGDSLLRDPSCKSKENLSEKGKMNAASIGEQFKSRGIPIESVLASQDCLAKETAKTAFGQVEPVEFLSLMETIPEQQADSYTAQLERRIGSYSGKGNLVLVK